LVSFGVCGRDCLGATTGIVVDADWIYVALTDDGAILRLQRLESRSRARDGGTLLATQAAS
jgi:hypothetical protein